MMEGQLSNDEKIGSGAERRPLDWYYCANTYCLKQGNLYCAKCGLVGYCSKPCQKEHWKVHKKVCLHSDFLSNKWQPQWLIDNRPPHYIKEDLPYTTAPSFGLGVHLWGNTPAFDLIGWKRNECKGNSVWEEPMKIVFAASGDFRSMVETLASVPANYEQPMTVILNDIHPVVVARNLLMLGLLLFEGEEAIDTVIALWYSVAMTEYQFKSIASFVCDHLLPLLESEQAKIVHGQSTLELNQVGEALHTIIEMMADEMDVQSALDARNSVMLDPSRKDYVDRHLIGLKEYHRESVVRFRTQGLVLPFGSPDARHNVPNKFLFLQRLGWLVDDSCDPNEGWDMLKVMEFGDEKYLPKNDLYGRLFFYIRDQLSKMVATIQRLPVEFRMFQKDARILVNDFEKEGIKFDRVDVSNISDENYVGIDGILNGWAPLLNKSNPNSAIVTLFLNWYHLFTDKPITNVAEKMGKAAALIGLDCPLLSQLLCVPSKYSFLQNTVLALTDLSDEFEEYMKKVMRKKPEYLKRRMNHTIVPHQVMYPIEADRKVTIDSLPASDQYFVLNWNNNNNNATRYAEWTFG